MDEQQAIQRLKKGDISGQQYLVERYQVKAVRTAFLITRDSNMAEDIVQESFLQAFRAMRGFDATRPFEPWFMRSVVNASLKMKQRFAREIRFLDEEEESDLIELSAKIKSIESQVESTMFQNQLWEVMQKLSPRQRAVIVQRYYLEMSEAEMAQEASSATGTIKWLLNAARKRLRSLLDDTQQRSEI